MKKLLVVSLLSLVLVSNAHAAILTLKYNCGPLTKNGSVMMGAPRLTFQMMSLSAISGHGEYYTMVETPIYPNATPTAIPLTVSNPNQGGVMILSGPNMTVQYASAHGARVLMSNGCQTTCTQQQQY